MRYFILMLMLAVSLMLAAEEELHLQDRVGIDPVLRGVWQIHSMRKEGEEDQIFDPPLDFAMVTAMSMTLSNGKRLAMEKVAIMQRGDAPPANVVVMENGVIYFCFKLPGKPDVLVQLMRDDGEVVLSLIIRVVQ